MSAILELQIILPPPSHPHNNSGDWALAERDLGLRLPEDFKQFTSLYGTVKICNYLWVYNPFAYASHYRSFRDFMIALNASYEEAPHGREHIPFPVYPESGGLFPVIGTDNSDIISWIPEGEPDTWRLFAWFYPGNETVIMESTVTQCLLDLLTLKSPLLPEHIPDDFFLPENRRLIVT
jgi:hypothetical protein